MQPTSIKNRKATTTDLTPIINWCDSEKVAVENSDDNVIDANDAIDLCNHFRESLKSAFRLLVDKINKVKEGVENNNYIDKSNLVRDDTIYIVSKIVNKEVHLEAEDVITYGIIKARLMVMKASEFNDIWYEEYIITISIVSRTIYKYVGCDYFSICTLNGKKIIIAKPQQVRVSGVSIRENSSVKRIC